MASTTKKSGESPVESGKKILELKITLKYIKPPIWRRIQVSSQDTFMDLHRYIQEAMGWSDCHLHNFNAKNNVYIGSDSDDLFGDYNFFKEDTTQLCKFLVNPNDKVRYSYDFGDNWQHEICVEKVLPFDDKQMFPKFMTGKRACPPEDCGGTSGYYHLLEVFANPDHPEYQELITEWLNDLCPDFDPEKLPTVLLY